MVRYDVYLCFAHRFCDWSLEEAIVSEEVVDETDQHECNQSKCSAERLTNVTIMQACVDFPPILFALTWPTGWSNADGI